MTQQNPTQNPAAEAIAKEAVDKYRSQLHLTPEGDKRWHIECIQEAIARDRAELEAELLSWKGNCERMCDQHGELSAELGIAKAKLAEQSAALDVYKASVELTHQILHDAPELSPSNYDHDEVASLNVAMLHAYKVLSDAIAQIEALAGKGGAK